MVLSCWARTARAVACEPYLKKYAAGRPGVRLRGGPRFCLSIPDAISVVNPAWRKLDGQIRSQAGRRHRLAAQFGALALSADPTESQVQGFQQRKGHLQEEIQVLDLEIDNLKQLRKKTEHHIPVKSLPEADRFTRLRTERKHFVDTIFGTR